MRTRRLDERGGSAIEAALLMAAVALVMLPALFLLGRAVDAAFSKPCEGLSNGACASSGDPNGGSAGNSGGSGPDGGSTDADATRSATRDLETWVKTQVPAPVSGGTTSVTCDDLETTTPPAGSTTSCKATYSNGDPPQQYVVEWGTDGKPLLKPA